MIIINYHARQSTEFKRYLAPDKRCLCDNLLFTALPLMSEFFLRKSHALPGEVHSLISTSRISRKHFPQLFQAAEFGPMPSQGEFNTN